MSLLIYSLMECWIVDDVLLSYSNSVVLLVYLVLKLETPRISYMNASLFDIGLIDLDVPDLAYPIFGSGSQSYEGH